MCREHYQLSYRGIDPASKIISVSYKTCWVPECQKRAVSKSLCTYHGRRARTGYLETPPELGVKLNPPCSFKGCERIIESRGLCHSHLIQFYKGGDLTELRVWGRYIKGRDICGVEHCRRAAWTKGLCSSHSRAVVTYGMSLEDAIALYDVNKCFNPGCLNTRQLHIDHDHDTGRVRGLLCGGCNKSLGFLGEDRDRIRGLLEYLDSQ